MVYLCNSIAVASPLVTVDVIDANAFPDLVSRFKVGAVPKVLINETVEVLDVVPAAVLIEKIAAAPPASPVLG
jgi:predicted thioredoxin/glutaredoxin